VASFSAAHQSIVIRLNCNSQNRALRDGFSMHVMSAKCQ